MTRDTNQHAALSTYKTSDFPTHPGPKKMRKHDTMSTLFEHLPSELYGEVYKHVEDEATRRAFRSCSKMVRDAESVHSCVNNLAVYLSQLTPSPFVLDSCTESSPVNHARTRGMSLNCITVVIDCPGSWVGRMVQLILQLRRYTDWFTSRGGECPVKEFNIVAEDDDGAPMPMMKTAKSMLWNMGVLLRRALPHLEDLYIDRSVNLSSAFYEGLLYHPMPRLRALTMPVSDRFPLACASSDVPKPKSLPSLEELSLEHGIRYGHQLGITSVLRSCPSLKSVHLSQLIDGVCWDVCPTLENLSIQRMYAPSTQSVLDLHKCGPRLKSVHIGVCYVNDLSIMQALTEVVLPFRQQRGVAWSLRAAACDGEYIPAPEGADEVDLDTSKKCVTEDLVMLLKVLNEDIIRFNELQLECMFLSAVGTTMLAMALPDLEHLNVFTCSMMDETLTILPGSYDAIYEAAVMFRSLKTLTYGYNKPGYRDETPIDLGYHTCVAAQDAAVATDTTDATVATDTRKEILEVRIYTDHPEEQLRAIERKWEAHLAASRRPPKAILCHLHKKVPVWAPMPVDVDMVQ